MTERPLTISVITPCLNSGQYLEKSLRSALEQQGDFRIQSVLRDAGSTDATPDILARLQQEVAAGTLGGGCLGIDLDWVSEPDKGQSDALNKTLGRTTGDVVVWLNADDWFAPGAFACALGLFSQSSSTDVVLGNCLQMVSDDTPLAGAPQRSFVNAPEKVSPFTGGVEWLLVTPEVFFRRSAIERFRFDLDLDYFMDVDLWHHLILSGYRWEKVEETLAFFRWHDDCKTLRAWRRFLPRLLVENQILFSRYRDSMNIAEAEKGFAKLMLHFVSNWDKAGTLEQNHAAVQEQVVQCTALSPEDRAAFLARYGAVYEAFTATAGA
jgi:glycosyltransferase involved in cell wall biosynthesis